MIEWLFLSHQPQCTIITYITVLCHLIIKGHEWTQRLFGYDPAFIHVPLTQVYLQQLSIFRISVCHSWLCRGTRNQPALRQIASKHSIPSNKASRKGQPNANNWGENCVSWWVRKKWTGCYCLARGQNMEKFCILGTFLNPKGRAFCCNHGLAAMAPGTFEYSLWLRIYCLHYSASIRIV